MPMVHLVSGLPCSGKTTYAKAVAADDGSVPFSLDYWLITAFGRYSIASVGHEEHTRRVLACRELIREAAAPLLARGGNIILDDGFFLREHRMQHVRWAHDLGAKAKIHFLNTPAEFLRRRVEQRNARLPAFNFHIDPEMLEAFTGLFEAPLPNEGAQLVVVEDDDSQFRLNTPWRTRYETSAPRGHAAALGGPDRNQYFMHPRAAKRSTRT